MPRTARVVIPGIPHHVTQRGNYRQKVFYTDKDKEQYVNWIVEYVKKYEVEVAGYCIMGNHVHFVVIPKKEESLSRLFNMAHMRYSQYMNKKLKALGHLWQGRFYSSPLGEESLKEVLRYVERNPVRAKMVKKAWDYEWSSAKEHIGGKAGKLPVTGIKEILGKNEKEWKAYIEEKDREDALKQIRLSTLNGKPYGSEKFITWLETKLKLKLRLLPRGRPWPKKDK